jgi:hypothetical protein
VIAALVEPVRGEGKISGASRNENAQRSFAPPRRSSRGVAHRAWNRSRYPRRSQAVEFAKLHHSTSAGLIALGRQLLEQHVQRFGVLAQGTFDALDWVRKAATRPTAVAADSTCPPGLPRCSVEWSFSLEFAIVPSDPVSSKCEYHSCPLSPDPWWRQKYDSTDLLIQLEQPGCTPRKPVPSEHQSLHSCLRRMPLSTTLRGPADGV